MLRSTCSICRRLCKNVISQQVATYLPPALPEVVHERINKQKYPSHNHDELNSSENARQAFRKKRLLYARFGAASGVDPASLFPSEKQVTAEAMAEKRWWPTLQEMQDNIKRKEMEEAEQKQERDRKIAENMAKMPQWIEKFEKEQLNLKMKQEQNALKRRTEIDLAKEKLGYNIDDGHPILREYLAGLKEQKRKAKKQAIKSAKALKKV